MQIVPAKSPEPLGRPFIRWGLRGGALAALGPVALTLIANMSGEAMLVVMGIGAAGGAMAFTIGALVFNRRQVSLTLVEKELERARAMMERRLISEGEYLNLKSQILSGYQVGSTAMPNLLIPAFWGAVLGMLGVGGIAVASMDMLIDTWIFSAIAAAAGGAVTGGVAQGAALIGGIVPQQLPAPEPRRLIEE